MVRVVMGIIVLAMAIPELLRLFTAFKKQLQHAGEFLRRQTRRRERQPQDAS